MGIASLVLGIIAVVTGWIPFICFAAFIFAIVGLILGIVDTVKKNKTNDKKRGISIAGLIVSAIAIPIIIFSIVISLVIVVAIVEDVDFNDYNWDTNYDEDMWYYDIYKDIYENKYNKINYDNLEFSLTQI